MLLSWLLFVLVCSCSGQPIPSSQAGEFFSHSPFGEVGEGEAGAPQWPPSLPRVMSALPEEQAILEEPVQEESTWEQGVNPGSESYPGQLETSYQASFIWPGQQHGHQHHQHSHHGHQHGHHHEPRSGIQFDTQKQQQQRYYPNIGHQEILLGLESGSVPSRFGADEAGGEHRVYQRHLGYQTLHGFQGNHSVAQGNQDGVWFKHHQAHVNGHQRYYGYQPNFSNVRSYGQRRRQHGAAIGWNLPNQHQEPLSYNNAFLGQTNFRYPQQDFSTQEPSTMTKIPAGQFDGSSEQEEENEKENEEENEEEEENMWSRGTSWISSLWPKAEEWGEPTVQE